VLVISLATLAWSFSRSGRRAGNFAGNSEGVPASEKQKVIGSRQMAGAGVTSSEATLVDSDNDGVPDVAELRTFQDRDNFRQWFTDVAEMQFYQLSDQWKSEQRDCAGLVRFAIREALRNHDRAWFQKMGANYETVAPDVAGFDLDHNPLGERIFRTDFGSFHESDLRDGRFSEFADGRTLKNFNTV